MASSSHSCNDIDRSLGGSILLALRGIMWVRSGREYGLCSSMSLWLGQSIAVHHRGTETQRIHDSSSPMPNSEEP